MKSWLICLLTIGLFPCPGMAQNYDFFPDRMEEDAVEDSPVETVFVALKKEPQPIQDESVDCPDGQCPNVQSSDAPIVNSHAIDIGPPMFSTRTWGSSITSYGSLGSSTGMVSYPLVAIQELPVVHSYGCAGQRAFMNYEFQSSSNDTASHLINDHGFSPNYVYSLSQTQQESLHNRVHNQTVFGVRNNHNRPLTFGVRRVFGRLFCRR